MIGVEVLSTGACALVQQPAGTVREPEPDGSMRASLTGQRSARRALSGAGHFGAGPFVEGELLHGGDGDRDWLRVGEIRKVGGVAREHDCSGVADCERYDDCIGG